MGNDSSKVEEIVELIRTDDFCAFASQLAENESIIKESDDYGRTLLWVRFLTKFRFQSISRNIICSLINKYQFYI